MQPPIRAAALVVALASASAPAIGQTARPAISAAPSMPELHLNTARLPDPQRVLALLDDTARAQIAQLRAPIQLNTRGGVNVNWINAAFLTGLTRLTRVSPASDGASFMRDVAEHYNFASPGAQSQRGMVDADNLAIGELYEELYARSGEPGEILPTRQRLDYNLPWLTLTPAPQSLVWWWCDALFMAPPVLARMSAQTHDPSYLRAMDVQWWRASERLWVPADGLFLRDARFTDRRTKNGKRVYWSRGNGWVIAGIARVLESMPADFASRPRYVEMLRAMSASLARLQGRDGLWTTSLLDPEDPAGPETSGSAFFTYAMAWGINHDILDRKTYLPVVLRGWAGLVNAIQPDGMLGYVQRTGDQPVPTEAGEHGAYGTGGLILAGLEVMRLGQPATALPLAEPPRDPPAPPRLPIELANRPRTTPEEEFQYQRAAAERQAMIDLAFIPPVPAAAPVAAVGGVAMPRITVQLTPPPETERAPRATVRFAPYRFDDLLWENDLTAHRIYGPALEAAEPPSSSGIDAWGKNVAWPFMERQLKTGKQHDYHGEGIDFYNVSTFRGAGGLGVWADNKLWVSRNFARYRILKDGPDVAEFEVDFAPWPVDVDRKVWETRRFTLPLGTHFTRMVSTIGSDKPDPLIVGIGISKRPTSTEPASFNVDRARGTAVFWSPTDPDKGAMGVAILVDPAMIVDIKEDTDNYLILLRVTPGEPFVYYSGAAWDKGADIHSEADWKAMVARQRPNFDPAAH